MIKINVPKEELDGYDPLTLKFHGTNELTFEKPMKCVKYDEEKQIAYFEEIAVFRELFDGISTMKQNAIVAVDIGNV